MKIPNHMAIIVDGNGRWAKEKGHNRSYGHKVGSENLLNISLYAFKKGIKYLSLYVLSCDNLKRSKEEVDFLFNLFITTFKSKKKIYMKENIKVVISGIDENLPPKVIESINDLVEITKDNTGGVLNMCLNYSSRREILDAYKKMKNLNLEEISPNDISKYMYHELPDIDFLVRTSGEMRLSDFMLFQASYAELYFPKTYFPDFDEHEFDLALEEYTKRDRRFGGIVYEDKNN
ncbi:MAG: di-trans,poly-cis-decaprenylcistransferase [Bacilli bacterium]|nr:di-trans,poly-cis-decaprenylcistransferase [Bacilli bacterium]